MARKHQSKNQVKPKKPRVVVAGAAGFIGSFLVESLLNAGCRVIGLDNLSTGSLDNLVGLKGNPDFDLIKCDLTQGTPENLKRLAVTHVVSAVGTSYVEREKKELDELLLASLATKNLLDLAVKKRAVFLLLSSTDIYQGVAGSLSLTHYYDHSRAAAKLSFLEARRYAEALTQEYSDLYNLDARIARVPVVYGPRMNLATNHVLAQLLKLALAQKDLIIKEDGSQECPVVYITDLTYGLTKLTLNQKKELQKSIFTFVNPEKVSVLSLAYALKEYYAKEPKVEFLPQGEIFEQGRRSKIDSSRARKELFWEPKVDLAEGIGLTIEYFQKQKKGCELAAAKKEIQKTDQRLKQPAIDAYPKKLLPAPSFLEKTLALVKPKKNRQSKEPHGWLALKKKKEVDQLKEVKGVQGRGRQPIWQRLSRRFTILVFGVSSLVLVLSPLLGTALFAYLGASQLQKKEFNLAQTNFLRAQSFWGKGEWAFKFLHQKPFFKSLDKGLRAAFFASRSLQDIWPSVLRLGALSQEVVSASPALGGESRGGLKKEQVVSVLESAQLNLQEAEKDVQFFVENFRGACLAKDSFFTRSVLKCEKALPASEQFGGLLKTLAVLLDPKGEFLGFGDRVPQTNLVLLQNNTELRATGGFLGSYAVIDLVKGEVTRLKVDDIYNPDGILKQKIAAPAVFEKYMGVKELGLRDANWWPHFPESAEKIATLYEFATTEKVVNVIAINLEIIKGFLRATGGIYLPSFDKTVTADNLFELAETHSEVGFKPGSTQKKDFLGELANELIRHLLKRERLDQKQLVWSLLVGFSQKNILIYSREPDLKRVAENQLWSGAVRKTGGDYLYVVDSNIGGNKANFWVSRSGSYLLNADRDGNLVADLKVRWQHTGLSETWPGGAYKNFLRVYVPAGSHLIEEGGFADKVQVYEEFGKQVLAGPVEVPVNSEKQINLKYQLPGNAGFKGSDKYSLLVQKQSGTEAEKFDFRLNLPLFLKLKAGKLQQSIRLTTDQQLKVSVSR